jgi:hypothetical protein
MPSTPAPPSSEPGINVEDRERFTNGCVCEETASIFPRWSQIVCHPKYKDLGHATRWAFGTGCSVA